MEIDINKLKSTTNALFDHLLKSGHTFVELENDFYWSIPTNQVYNIYEKPKNLTIGQLSDDLLNAERCSDSSSVPICFALVWMSSILRALGEELPD